LLDRQRSENALERGTEAVEPDNMFDVPRKQQLVHHVEDQERDHAVIREALPGFGEGEEEEAFRVTEPCAVQGRFARSAQKSTLS
jgi:hypothetical protein